MSDRTASNLVIWHATPKQLKKIEEALHIEGLIDDELTLGEVAYGSEVPMDAHERIAGLIESVAPSVIFETWVDPKYEYSGEMIQYAPGLGQFACQTNADGEELFSREQVITMLANPLHARKTLGLEWRDVIKAARTKLQKDRA